MEEAAFSLTMFLMILSSSITIKNVQEDALENIKITKTLLSLQGKITDKQQTLKNKYKATNP